MANQAASNPATSVQRSSVTRTTAYAELPQWLTVEEVAIYLDCTGWTVYMQVRAGVIPHWRNRKRILISRELRESDQGASGRLGRYYEVSCGT